MKYAALFAGCACVLSLISAPASAQVLMLDFGPTTAAGNDRLNSPYHTENTSFTDVVWNKIGIADVTSGLLYSATNSNATGVTLDLGATTVDGATLINLANTPSNGTGLNGSTMTSGVYAGTAPGRDGIFTGANGTASRFVGLQIGGLAAGTYEIYMTGRNTNTSAGHTQNFFAGKSASSGNFDATTLSTQVITYFASPTLQNNAWSGSGGLVNYAKFSIALSSGEFLNLAARGGAGDARGFLNSIQVVNTAAIPEPAAAGFLGGLAALAGAACLRRRRS